MYLLTIHRSMIMGSMIKTSLAAILLMSTLSCPAQGVEESEILDNRVDSLLAKAPSVEYLVRMVNVIIWRSDIVADFPSISPVRTDATRHIANTLSSPFGSRVHPIFMTNHSHSGIDIPGKEKDTIYASGNGIVHEIGMDDQLGGFIRLQHKYNLMSIYGHMRKALCFRGDTIVIGQPIGLMGNTGSSTGAHLHYSIKFGQSFVDPLPFCYLMFEYMKRLKGQIQN